MFTPGQSMRVQRAGAAPDFRARRGFRIERAQHKSLPWQVSRIFEKSEYFRQQNLWFARY
jgi:hypothetical protein